MQPAYQVARESDRHFASHVWRKVPIPCYDPTEKLHQHIASGHVPAEALAGSLLDDNYVQDKVIREALSNSGITDQMDSLGRRWYWRTVSERMSDKAAGDRS